MPEENEESGSLRFSARLGVMMGVELDRSRSNCDELDRTRTPQKIGLDAINYEEWPKSIEL